MLLNHAGNQVGKERQVLDGMGDRPALPMVRFMLGTILVMVPLGQVLCWARLRTTLQRYLEYKSEGGTIESMEPVTICTWVSFALSTAVFGRLVEMSRSPKSVALVGAAIGGLALMLSSLCTSVASISFCYGVLLGISCGAYIVPLYYVTQCFPHTLGVMMGFATACFATGEIVMYYLMGYLLDLTELPLNAGEEIPYENFKKVPSMFRYIAILYLVSVLLGGFLLPEPKEIMLRGIALGPMGHFTFGAEEKRTDKFRMLKKWYFWLLPLMAFVGFLAGTLVVTNYVDVGVQLTNLSRDASASVGDWAVIAGIVGRLIWGMVSDAFGYHYALLAVSVLMGSFVISFGFIHDTGLFHMWACFLYFSWAGNAAVLPTAVAELFGKSDFAFHFPVAFIAACLGIVMSILLSTPFVNSFDGQTSLMVMAFLCGCSNLLIFPVRYFCTNLEGEQVSSPTDGTQSGLLSRTHQSQCGPANGGGAPNLTGTTNISSSANSSNEQPDPYYFSAFRQFSRVSESASPKTHPKRFSTLPGAFALAE